MVRYDGVIGLAMKLLREADDACDVAQEVFLRSYKYIHRLELDRPLEPRLMRMTVNVYRDMGRKSQRRRVRLPNRMQPAKSMTPVSGIPTQK